MLYYCCIAESGVELSSVQRTNEPTRDVYVTRKSNGEREFSGFGLPADSYSDCFLAADKLPEDDIKVMSFVNTLENFTRPLQAVSHFLLYLLF